MVKLNSADMHPSNDDIRNFLLVSLKVHSFYLFRRSFAPRLSFGRLFFLLYSFTVDEIIPSSFIHLGLSNNTISYYFNHLVSREYLIRISYAHYEHTEKSKSLYSAFLIGLSETDLAPLFPPQK